jgi:D-arabinose 1-dehydrogenase-like Zn-dependent alcohol dehydrogenase
MATMRALLLHEYGGPLEVAEVPRPEPGPDEVLVRVEACGLGLTVANIMDGRLRAGPPRLPLIPGHEVAGVVEALGERVNRPAPGDRVITSFYLTCGWCRFCRAGREPLCENLRGYVGADIDGGYADYMAVPAANALPLPSGIDPVQATSIPDAIGTPFHVCHTRAQVRPGQRVLVTGAAGGVGVHMVQMARLFGADVVAADIDDARLERVREYGAGTLVNFERTADRALDAPVDVAIDLVGTPETLGWCYDALDRGGVLVNLTTHRGLTTLPVPPAGLVMKEATVMGSRYVARWELLRAIELVASGRIRPVVSEACSLDGAPALFDRLRRQQLFGRGAVIPAASFPPSVLGNGDSE